MDNDKELILPVLEKISKIYQDYTIKQIKFNLNQSKKYLGTQIDEYGIKTQKSIQDLQNYSDKYNILIPRFEELKFDLKENSNQLNNYLLLMNSDLDIQYKIDETKEKLNSIENNSNDIEGTLLIANSMKIIK